MIDIYSVAKVAHEFNRAWCQINNDYSQKPWDEAPDWQRERVINGINFHLDNPDASSGQSHLNWMEYMLDEGWSYGPVKNETLKEHPCMVSFEELPIQQQVKDHMVKSVVKAAVNNEEYGLFD